MNRHFEPFCFSLLFITCLHLCPPVLLSVPWMSRSGVIRPGQPSPALLPDRCQQGAAALAWVSQTTKSTQGMKKLGESNLCKPGASLWCTEHFLSTQARSQEPATSATSGYKSIVTWQTEFVSQSACHRLVWLEKGKAGQIKKLVAGENFCFNTRASIAPKM